MFRIFGDVICTKTSNYIIRTYPDHILLTKKEHYNHPEYVDDCEIMRHVNLSSKCSAGTFILVNHIIYRNGKPFMNLKDHYHDYSTPTKIWAFDYNGGFKLFVSMEENGDIYDCINHLLYKRTRDLYMYLCAGIIINYRFIANQEGGELIVFGETFKFTQLINDMFISNEKTKYTIHTINGFHINYIREISATPKRTKPALKFD